MNALDLVKAAKSALGDFGTFWTELNKIAANLPGVFRTFGNWANPQNTYKDNTDAALQSIKDAGEARREARTK